MTNSVLHLIISNTFVLILRLCMLYIVTQRNGRITQWKIIEMLLLLLLLFLLFLLCIDINECLNQDICGPGNVCINTEGSYMCACHKSGHYYVRQERNCIGKSKFLCYTYHMLPIIKSRTYITTTDVDECVLGMHNCDGNATCYNTDGSFTCSCNEGYYGNGELCSPVGKTVCMFACHVLILWLLY